MKRKFSISLLFLVLSVIMFGLTLGINAKVSTVGENYPIGPVQTFEKAQPVQGDFADKVNLDNQTTDNNNVNQTMDQTTNQTTDIQSVDQQTTANQNNDNVDYAKVKRIAPSDNRPFVYSNNQVRAGSSKNIDNNEPLDDVDIKTGNNKNYYAVYDEYAIDGENYKSIGQTFILSNQSDFIEEQLEKLNKSPNEIKSTLQIDVQSEEEDDKTPSSTNEVQTSSPVYEVIAIKKYPEANAIMNAITIISMFAVIGYIGYLIYRLIRIKN